MTKELNELAFCSSCDDKNPPVIVVSAFLIPVRELPYDMLPSADIDKRLMGVCAECLGTKNKFQRSKKRAVDHKVKHLIYKNEE